MEKIKLYNFKVNMKNPIILMANILCILEEDLDLEVKLEVTDHYLIYFYLQGSKFLIEDKQYIQHIRLLVYAGNDLPTESTIDMDYRDCQWKKIKALLKLRSMFNEPIKEIENSKIKL